MPCNRLLLVVALASAAVFTACGVSSNTGDVDAGAEPDASTEPATFAGPCEIQTDNLNDGTTDRRDVRSYVDRRLVRLRRDDNVDGTDDYVQTRTYDGLERLQFLDEDNPPADGVIDLRRIYNYRADDQVDRIDFDTGNDDTIDRIQTYTYDGSNRLVLIEDDLQNDGAPDRRFQRKYNNLDQLTRIERDDAPFDGILVTREDRTYDSNGRLSAQLFDDNGDGTIDRRFDYVRDGIGNVIQVEIDNNVDGMTDDRQYWSYGCFE